MGSEMCIRDSINPILRSLTVFISLLRPVIHHGLPKIMTWTEGRPRKTKLGIHDEARFRRIIGREFYVHSGGFKSVGRLCIGGDCFEMMWSSNGDDLQSPLEVTRVPH